MRGALGVLASTGSKLGYAIAQAEPVVMADATQETRFTSAPLSREHRAGSGVTVVVPLRERPFGVLTAHPAGRRSFSEDDVHSCSR